MCMWFGVNMSKCDVVLSLVRYVAQESRYLAVFVI